MPTSYSRTYILQAPVSKEKTKATATVKKEETKVEEVIEDVKTEEKVEESTEEKPFEVLSREELEAMYLKELRLYAIEVEKQTNSEIDRRKNKANLIEEILEKLSSL